MKSPDLEANKILHSVRMKTDTSLANERTKTDVSLAEEQEAAEQRADKLLQSNRQQADQAQTKKRETIDANKEEARAAPGHDIDAERAFDDESLELERSATDAAHLQERANTDAAVAKERRRLKLAAEALFALERGATDADLLGERTKVDSEVELVGVGLIDEVSAHNETKALMTVVSHGLKNPLSVIWQTGELLQAALISEQIVSPEIHRLLGLIRRNAGAMDRLVTDLVDLERLNAGRLPMNMAQEDLGDLLDECKDIFDVLASTRHISFATEVVDGPVSAYFDRNRILQVLSNLIQNALKHTPKGGLITVRASRDDLQVEVKVVDTGEGVPVSEQERIFDKFSQITNKNHYGVGLGLHISRAIVEAHGGTISVDSEPGKGSSFRFTIPLKQSPSKP